MNFFAATAELAIAHHRKSDDYFCRISSGSVTPENLIDASRLLHELSSQLIGAIQGRSHDAMGDILSLLDEEKMRSLVTELVQTRLKTVHRDRHPTIVSIDKSTPLRDLISTWLEDSLEERSGKQTDGEQFYRSYIGGALLLGNTVRPADDPDTQVVSFLTTTAEYNAVAIQQTLDLNQIQSVTAFELLSLPREVIDYFGDKAVVTTSTIPNEKTIPMLEGGRFNCFNMKKSKRFPKGTIVAVRTPCTELLNNSEVIARLLGR